MGNKRIIIVGGGSSVRQDVWDKPVSSLPLWNILKNEATISINYVFRYLNPTIACFHDETFYRSNLEELKLLPLIVGVYARNVEAVLMPNTYLFKNRTDWVMNQWETAFYGSNLCGVFALSVAINLGYKEIFLLGYDFGAINGITHFYHDDINLEERDCNHQLKYRGVGFRDDGHGNKIHRTSNYENKSEKYFTPFENYKDVSIINVGVDSRLQQFPKIDYGEFYSHLENNPQPIEQPYVRDEIEATILTHRK